MTSAGHSQLLFKFCQLLDLNVQESNRRAILRRDKLGAEDALPAPGCARAECRYGPARPLGCVGSGVCARGPGHLSGSVSKPRTPTLGRDKFHALG